LSEGLLTVREGKGGKDRVVPIGETAQSFLERYLEEGRPHLRRSRFEEHVFLSRFGKPLSKTQLMRLMEGVGKAAGLGKPLTCHGLRHSCATHMLQGGADIRHLQELLGHRTLSATQVYTHVAASDLKRVHARCHPRERKGRK
jgi:integrase/recombinase XerD